MDGPRRQRVAAQGSGNRIRRGKGARHRIKWIDSVGESGRTGAVKIAGMMMKIVAGDLADPRIIALLRIHVDSARAATAPGGAMLRHIIAAARAQGMSRLSLETGSWDFFRPARAFYQKHGFAVCEPFGDYVLDPNSVFMTLELGRSGTEED